MSGPDPNDPARLGPEAEGPDSPDGWATEPDRWEASDREWREKWEGREDDDPPEPPSAAYRPEKASVRSVTSSYEDGMREAGPYLTIGLQIAFSMLFFVGVGWALDEWAGTSPWGVLVGTVLGFLGVIGLVIRLAGEGKTPKR